MTDYYAILNVSPKAGVDDIRKAYRKLAFRYHPDALGDGGNDSESFRRLNEAYRVLSNPVERKKYHQKLFTEGLNVDLLVLTPTQSYTSLLHFYEDLRTADRFRIPERWVLQELAVIVPDSILLTMQSSEPEAFNDSFVELYLKCIESLSYQCFIQALERLSLLPLSAAMRTQIAKQTSDRKQAQFWEKHKLLFALAAAVVICVMMYFGFSL